VYKLDLRKEWDRAIYELTSKFITNLKENFISIIALDENYYIYDSNVLIVVKKIDNNIREQIAKIVLDINDKYNCTISYYIAEEKDKDLIELFSKSEKEAMNDCQPAFEELKEKAKTLPITKMIFLGDYYIYDSNTLIVVKEINDYIREQIAKIVLDINDKYNCTISYYIVEETNIRLINEFEKARYIVK
jgi:hypothetical protein